MSVFSSPPVIAAELARLFEEQSSDLGTPPSPSVRVLVRLAFHSNLSTTAMKIVVKAGLTPWPKFWNALRACCLTDMMDTHGLRRACQWSGNTPAVAMRIYALTKHEDFEDLGDATQPMVDHALSGVVGECVNSGSEKSSKKVALGSGIVAHESDKRAENPAKNHIREVSIAGAGLEPARPKRAQDFKS
jgi:hypothetical protein